MFGKYNGFVSKARVSACMYFLVCSLKCKQNKGSSISFTVSDINAANICVWIICQKVSTKFNFLQTCVRSRLERWPVFVYEYIQPQTNYRRTQLANR